MKNLIERKAVIDAVLLYNTDDDDAIIDLLLEIESIPAADMLSKWIPVAELLPEEPYGCLIIVWDCPYGGGDDFLNLLPYFAEWDGQRWIDADGQQVPFEVAYWMPLPELPKEGERWADECTTTAQATR